MIRRRHNSIKIIKAVCLITVIGLLCGCGQGSAPAVNTAGDDALSAAPSGSDAQSAVDTQPAGDVLPQITHTPNIIDDNYRNYYEIFPGSFCDSDGDKCGDLKGIESRLDYISDLGCNGIWLTPIMAAPSYHKYDTTDYYAVDPAFGTNNDFKALADACHERGIRIIIDMVINHSSNEHPWFKEACEYLRDLPEDAEPDLTECPYVDYYHFAREKLNGSYCEVPGTDWYYEAVFYYTQPDLNLYNTDLVSELENVASFWIGLGCDGFRMDAVMHYDDSASDHNISFLHDYYEYCRGLNPDFYMVSEVWAAEKTIAEYYTSRTPSFFNFDAADAEGKLIKAGRGALSAEKFVNACVEYHDTYSASNPDYIDAPFITNHDMGRVANALKSDPVSMKMAGGLLLTMNGSPFIYYGEEIGMKSKGKPDENKRLHMNWTADADAAGMCADPAGADKDIEQSFAPADEQTEDPESIYSYYKEALAIRNAYPEIARGLTEVVKELTNGDIAVITRTWQDKSVGIIYNTGDEAAQTDPSNEAIASMKIAGVLCADPDADGADEFSAAVRGAGSGASISQIGSGQLTVPARSIIILGY